MIVVSKHSSVVDVNVVVPCLLREVTVLDEVIILEAIPSRKKGDEWRPEAIVEVVQEAGQESTQPLMVEEVELAI
jgi:hypothetical protein